MFTSLREFKIKLIASFTEKWSLIGAMSSLGHLTLYGIVCFKIIWSYDLKCWQLTISYVLVVYPMIYPQVVRIVLLQSLGPLGLISGFQRWWKRSTRAHIRMPSSPLKTVLAKRPRSRKRSRTTMLPVPRGKALVKHGCGLLQAPIGMATGQWTGPGLWIRPTFPSPTLTLETRILMLIKQMVAIWWMLKLFGTQDNIETSHSNNWNLPIQS